jgi:hypothetical protein
MNFPVYSKVVNSVAYIWNHSIFVLTQLFQNMLSMFTIHETSCSCNLHTAELLPRVCLYPVTSLTTLTEKIYIVCGSVRITVMHVHMLQMSAHKIMVVPSTYCLLCRQDYCHFFLQLWHWKDNS